jgi:hypothetical protein
MKFLQMLLLLILSAGSLAAQDASKPMGAPDVEVVQVSWRRVDRNPKLDDATLAPNPERALRMEVNAARINSANSARMNQPGPVPPPVLLSVPPLPDSPPTVRPWSGYIYEFKVRNTGTKTIRRVAWEYSFSDPITKRKVGRRNYKSKVKILPGMTANLVVRSSLPPIGTIDAKRAGLGQQDQSPDQMIIQKIEYTDGSVWQRGSK